MKQGEEKQEEDQNKQPDIQPEDNAIERSEDFEGKVQDVDAEGNWITSNLFNNLDRIA